jgi:hypothetical protein
MQSPVVIRITHTRWGDWQAGAAFLVDMIDVLIIHVLIDAA